MKVFSMQGLFYAVAASTGFVAALRSANAQISAQDAEALRDQFFHGHYRRLRHKKKVDLRELSTVSDLNAFHGLFETPNKVKITINFDYNMFTERVIRFQDFHTFDKVVQDLQEFLLIPREQQRYYLQKPGADSSEIEYGTANSSLKLIDDYSQTLAQLQNSGEIVVWFVLQVYDVHSHSLRERDVTKQGHHLAERRCNFLADRDLFDHPEIKKSIQAGPVQVSLKPAATISESEKELPKNAGVMAALGTISSATGSGRSKDRSNDTNQTKTECLVAGAKVDSFGTSSSKASGQTEKKRSSHLSSVPTPIKEDVTES